MRPEYGVPKLRPEPAENELADVEAPLTPLRESRIRRARRALL